MSGRNSRRGRRDRFAGSPFVAAALIALGWHAALAVGLRPRPPVLPAPPPFVPAVDYRAGAAAMDESDLLRPGWVALHSPILFARPSAVGFAAPRKRPERHPSLDLPAWPLRLLPRPPDPVTEAAVLLPPSLEQSARQHLADVAAAAQPFQTRPPTGRAEWTVSGLDPALAAPDAFPVAPEQRGEAPWDARATVTFGRDGRPCRVLLDEPPADAGVAAELVAGLYRWRVPAADAERRVRVILRYEGRRTPRPVSETP